MLNEEEFKKIIHRIVGAYQLPLKTAEEMLQRILAILTPSAYGGLQRQLVRWSTAAVR